MSKRFDISYHEGEERRVKLPKDGFDTIAEAVEWCKAKHLPLEIIRITEWDNETITSYGTGEIVASVNLACAAEDQAEDLLTYQTY